MTQSIIDRGTVWVLPVVLTSLMLSRSVGGVEHDWCSSFHDGLALLAHFGLVKWDSIDTAKSRGFNRIYLSLVRLIVTDSPDFRLVSYECVAAGKVNE